MVFICGFYSKLLLSTEKNVFLIDKVNDFNTELESVQTQI